VLRNKRYYIRAVAWLIPHANGPAEIALRLERFDTTSKSDPKVEISLTETEISELCRYVTTSSSIRDHPPGSYALLRIDEGRDAHDSVTAAQALATLLGNPQLASALRRPEVADVLAASMNDVIRLGVLRSATSQLETLLDTGESNEERYQEWLEKHTWALGNVYVRRDAVRRISAADDIDVLVESALNGLRDVYELKRPDAPVLNYDKEHKSFYWTSVVTKAIGQCHRYLDVLHDKLRTGLDDHPEIVAYHPRAVIIVGRSNSWNRQQFHALHGLNARLHSISVMTYDQLLSQCRTMLSHVGQ
jgi:hypothetical protein